MGQGKAFGPASQPQNFLFSFSNRFSDGVSFFCCCLFFIATKNFVTVPKFLCRIFTELGTFGILNVFNKKNDLDLLHFLSI